MDKDLAISLQKIKLELEFHEKSLSREGENPLWSLVLSGVKLI